jgi:hypothetical protein
MNNIEQNIINYSTIRNTTDYNFLRVIDSSSLHSFSICKNESNRSDVILPRLSSTKIHSNEIKGKEIRKKTLAYEITEATQDIISQVQTIFRQRRHLDPYRKIKIPPIASLRNIITISQNIP